MKRILWTVPAILVLSLAAGAQTPQAPAQQEPAQTQMAQAPEQGSRLQEWEIGGGYTYLRANLRGTGSSFGLNGGTGSVTENLNNWFGGRFEFYAWDGTVGGTNVTAQLYTYGPVFSYRRPGKFTAFAHAQFGAIHASAGYLGISQSANKFAMTAGGGLDFKVSKRAAIRFQGDYLLTNYLSRREDNVLFATSLVFYLGHRNPSGAP
jgi:opacity protein-like surface antigen